MRDAQGVEDRRVQVVRAEALSTGSAATRSLRPYTWPPGCRGAGERDRVTVRVVIAARTAIDARRPAKLRHPHNQRFIESASRGQVFEQREAGPLQAAAGRRALQGAESCCRACPSCRPSCR